MEVLAPGYHFNLSSALSISEADDPDPAETYILSLSGLVFPLIDEESGRTTFTLRPCSVTLPEVSGRTAEIEPTTIQNLSTFDLAVELSSIEDSIELRTSQGVLLAGVALDEPGEEALPESKRDDRLVDVDEDGEPGMSLLVDGWKVYTAMRIKMALEGQVLSNGSIQGNGLMSIEFGMYGDNVPFVDAASQAEEAIEELIVENQEHLFEFLPVVSDAMNCEAIAPSTIVHSAPEVNDDDSQTDNNAQATDENMAED